jgi:hypothetical protein
MKLAGQSKLTKAALRRARDLDIKFGHLDPDEFGPSMAALNPLERRFVELYVNNPGTPGAHLIKAAGYKGASSLSRRVQASRLLHRETVLKAIHETVGKRLRGRGAPLGLKVLVDQASGEGSRMDQRQAAIELLNRSGFAVTHQQHVVVERKMTEGETLARIKMLLAELGPNPQQWIDALENNQPTKPMMKLIEAKAEPAD